jgi:hypothetical protein
MRRLLLIALVAAGAVTSPASAEGGCENAGGLEVISAEGGSASITTPSELVANPVESKEFLVDLGEATTAELTVSMTWGIAANDYDLAVTSNSSGGASDGYQPFDPVIETVKVSLGTCEIVIVDVIDYLAPVFIDEIALDFAFSSVV